MERTVDSESNVILTDLSLAIGELLWLRNLRDLISETSITESIDFNIKEVSTISFAMHMALSSSGKYSDLTIAMLKENEVEARARNTIAEDSAILEAPKALRQQTNR
ncbi:hypothetical protein Trydic_g15205 [Trypoxylus dichotomus]